MYVFVIGSSVPFKFLYLVPEQLRAVLLDFGAKESGSMFSLDGEDDLSAPSMNPFSERVPDLSR